MTACKGYKSSFCLPVTILISVLIPSLLYVQYKRIGIPKTELQEVQKQSNNVVTASRYFQKSDDSNSFLTLIDLNELDNGSDFENIPCFSASYRYFSVPFCTYPAREDHSSKMFLKSKRLYKHSSTIFQLIQMLETDKSLQFVDIGANLGIYTVPIASRGYTVLAVEANRKTARILRKSIQMGNISGKVTLVNNGLTSIRKVMSMASNVPNKGSNYLLELENCTQKGCIPDEVRTVLLDDLIPLMKFRKAIIKVDIQGSEIDVFTKSAASKFFREIQVPLIQMEWVMYKNKFPLFRTYTKEQVSEWLNFFYDLKYTVHDPRSGKQLHANWKKWPFDIILKKQYS